MLKGMPTPPRLPFLYDDYPVYFLTACTYGRRDILARPDAHKAFIRFGLSAFHRGVYVGRYVLMPDHIHLFAGFGPGSPSLSVWVKSLKNSISKVLKSASIPTPHWQRGFFDHVLRSEESYEEKWIYVKENPVRAGLVMKSEDWPYAGEICPLTLV